MYKSHIYKFPEGEAKFTWIPSTDFQINNAEYPLTQSYGVCFNEKGEILVIRTPQSEEWSLPGGTIELNETPDQTLKREFLEEVTIEIADNPILLGAQLCESFPNGNNRIYQLRYACQIKEIFPQKPDPANNILYIMKFVPASKVTEYVKWNVIGDEIFKQAQEIAKNNWKLELN